MQRSTRIKVLVLGLAVALAAPVVAGASSRPPTGSPRGSQAAAPTVAVRVPKVLAALAPSKVFAACSSGAHTLSRFGDRVYPDQGNGGYTSLHTDVHLNYDAPTNMFLPGTHVDLTVRSTQCLSDLSFDFERAPLNGSPDGANMTVDSVEINGSPATFAFVQPTYPGDPNGQDDPDPAAHAISNVNPVSATNPNPPACSPQVGTNAQNGMQCPANKLVVTPSVPIPDGTAFTVTIDYTGRPGVHFDGDGTTEGWFRVNTTAAPNDGAFVTTEPVGTASWMPLDNHPSAKPTYDVYDTTNVGKTAIANGELVGTTPPGGTTYAPVSPTSANPPDANFPDGSWTWHWHSPEHVASYLVENSIGSYDLTARTSPTTGIQYFEAQARAITDARKAINKIAMDTQEDITTFQTMFDGPYPFTTAGVVVGIPPASFEEEMQTKITFAGGTIGGASGTSLGTLNHENMHQWFGDNVSEGAFNLTFWKEGFARLGEYLNNARAAATAAGGLGTPAGDAAFESSLSAQFNSNYGAGGNNWITAPSNPTVGSLFTTSNTYNRPATTYIALWHVLGKDRMISAMKQIQSQYGGASITEAQEEAVFRQWLPVQSASCTARLDQFFPQWFDTAYPAGGGLNKPQLSGPGLNGQGFPCAQVGPASPNGRNGWYTSDVSLTWSGFPTPPTGSTVTKNGCVDETISTDGTFTRSCGVTTTNATGAVTGSSGDVSETIKRDATPPETKATLKPSPVGAWFSPRTVTLDASDATSGVASTEYRVDGGPWTPYTGPFFVATFGPHTLEFRSTDVAGNVEATETVSWGSDFDAAAQLQGLSDFLASLDIDNGLATSLQNKLKQAGKKLGTPDQACKHLEDFEATVIEWSGKNNAKLTVEQANELLSVRQIEALLGCG